MVQRTMVAYAVVFVVFVNDVGFFSGGPQGNKGMLPDPGGEEAWTESCSEHRLWVACLFTGSLQIHSAPHMVWITTAEPLK